MRDWAVNSGYFFEIGVRLGGADNHPVTPINWYDAVAWCNAKSEMEGLTPVYWLDGGVYRGGRARPTVSAAADGYRLPTLGEWEWAARGGPRSEGYTYSGSDDLAEVGWYNTNAGDGPETVATKAANELGIHDMSGNVREWCDTMAYNFVPYLLGGGYANASEDCRVFFRGSANPDYSFDSYGFRVARNAED